MTVNGRRDQKLPNIYTGFNIFIEKVLKSWEKKVISYGDEKGFREGIDKINEELLKRNIILFFDHHYAFDALPLGIALGNYVNPVANVIIPYAVHLDMGLGREGEHSIRYWIRTIAFQWFIKRIKGGNPGINFYPVVREFELDNYRLKKVVDTKFKGINTTYLRTFIRKFSENASGQVCFLTPFSGIGFPGKPALHPQLFRSIKLVLANTNHQTSFYITGAYPDWEIFHNYLAPLFMNHRIYIQGPFEVPTSGYQEATEMLENELNNLRETANFTPPDYDKLLMK